RVLFTTLGSPSHGRAQLPLARALAPAGPEVLVTPTPARAAGGADTAAGPRPVPVGRADPGTPDGVTLRA
ncbi:hypothetical protein ACE14D_25855, partial [Streptomyces sp. Act-28]